MFHLQTNHITIKTNRKMKTISFSAQYQTTEKNLETRRISVLIKNFFIIERERFFLEILKMVKTRERYIFFMILYYFACCIFIKDQYK